MRIVAAALCGAWLLTGCGGGGGAAMAPVGWTQGSYAPADRFAAKCVKPRVGTDPYAHAAYPDRAGTLLDENNWLRSWTNDLYLWYSEVVDRNPSLFASTEDYFAVLKTTAITSSGADKDRFHFIYPTDQWDALALSGVQAGYGVQWAIVADKPPRQVLVAYTEPGSPAASAPANLVRGAEVLFVDGIDVVNANTQADVDAINAGLSPSSPQETHVFLISDPGGAQRTVTLVSADIATSPVQHVGTIAANGGSVGYMLFNDHLAMSEAALIAAFRKLRNAGVSDLVLDIRYNGGGYLDIASEVAYMIAGPAATAGQTFELTRFNNKHPTTDPVTGQPIAPVPFFATAKGYSVPAGTALPTLSLSRVFVLTGRNTCSASEAIINGLRGVNVQVIQVGTTTCGKPYGFYPQDNCGTTYFSIEFRGVNAANYGDYTDGFSPQNAPAPAGTRLPGCFVHDDFSREPGDPSEARLAAALSYRDLGAGSCPAVIAISKSLRTQQRSAVDARLPDSPLRQLRLLRH